jgi:hypothetical protein
MRRFYRAWGSWIGPSAAMFGEEQVGAAGLTLVASPRLAARLAQKKRPRLVLSEGTGPLDSDSPVNPTGMLLSIGGANATPPMKQKPGPRG